MATPLPKYVDMLVSRFNMPSTYSGSTQPDFTNRSPALRIASVRSVATALSWIRSLESMDMVLQVRACNIGLVHKRFDKIIEHGIIQKMIECNHDGIWC